MDWINLLVAVVSGAVGSLLFTSYTTLFQERAKARHVAETDLYGRLLSYKQGLEYTREVRRLGNYDVDQASIQGQEELAEAVVRAMPHLGRRTRKSMRDGITALVGLTTLTPAEGRAWIPVDKRDPHIENFRHESEPRKIALNDGYVDGCGHLGWLLHPNRVQEFERAYQAALVELERMAELVKP